MLERAGWLFSRFRMGASTVWQWVASLLMPGFTRTPGNSARTRVGRRGGAARARAHVWCRCVTTGPVEVAGRVQPMLRPQQSDVGQIPLVLAFRRTSGHEVGCRKSLSSITVRSIL